MYPYSERISGVVLF